jgi:thiamine biosynthesis protein ThiS
LVNGDVEFARAAGVGLHLPERGLAPSVARGRLEPGTLIGRSVHTSAEARASDGADFLVAGSVFPTESHPGRKPLGLPGLRDIAEATRLPVLAIGGIGPERIAGVIAAGAYGVCVVGAVASAPDIQTATRQANALRRALDDAIRKQGETKCMSPIDQSIGEQTEVAVELNGKTERLPPRTTIAAFLAGKGLQDKLVVVEVNGKIVARSAFAEWSFEDGDSVEIVHFVGGG